MTLSVPHLFTSPPVLDTIPNMKIGIDCRLPFYQMGGISQYVLHLLPALAEVDNENVYTVFHSRKDGRSYQPSTPKFKRSNLWTPCHHRIERMALTAELTPHQLDLFHSPDFIPPQRGGRRHVITVHDLNFIFYPQFLTKESLRYYAGQIRWAVQKADHISADSHATRRDVIEQLNVPPEKITTVHLSVNPLYQRPYSLAEIDQTLKAHNLPRGFVLAVGTLEPRKNYPSLIRAYAKLRQETAVDVPLIIVGGKGWIYDDIFTTIDELGLREHVRHL
ncbi:MAG: glycosyltransferase family 1 protein, partial [Chloroflexota bacterium]